MRRAPRLLCLALVLGLLSAAPPPALAQSSEPSDGGIGESGLKLPRFVSLSVDKAYLRTGPGRQYPILWIYVRENYPLEVIAEYGPWRKVRDVEGTTGWMHGRLLVSRRSGLVTERERLLRASPEPDGRPLLRMEPGVIGEIDRCRGAWCRMDVRGRMGWIPREHIWGTYWDEDVN